MAGTIKTQVQLGDSVTATQNFTLTSEAADGTMKLARGNKGATTQDILTIDTAGKPDFTQLARSLGASGYYTMPGGLIFQWGQTGAITNGAGKTVTFPLVFPTAAYVGFVIGNTSGGGAEANHSVQSVSTTTLTFTNSSATTQTFFWFAIGK